MNIKLKRIYEPLGQDDGCRILIDRLWPRGLKKQPSTTALWLKEIAPSQELRRWFGHDPQKWTEFKRHYFRELDGNPEGVSQLIRQIDNGSVTLLFAAKDETHSNAAALKEYLMHKQEYNVQDSSSRKGN